MNERINKLRIDSTLEIEDVDADGETYYRTELDVEKFAELIVRECANFAYNYSYNEENVEYYRENGWDCLSGDLRSEMKEHFGVEE